MLFFTLGTGAQPAVCEENIHVPWERGDTGPYQAVPTQPVPAAICDIWGVGLRQNINTCKGFFFGMFVMLKNEIKLQYFNQ